VAAPSYGEVWLADLDPTAGREQAGLRPVLVVSPTAFNRGDLVLAVPFTRTDRGSPLHVRIDPPEGGLRAPSFAMCEQIRALPRRRLRECWGSAGSDAMRAVGVRLRRLLPEP
jgi:mRNA interferase MazF